MYSHQQNGASRLEWRHAVQSIPTVVQQLMNCEDDEDDDDEFVLESMRDVKAVQVGMQ